MRNEVLQNYENDDMINRCSTISTTNNINKRKQINKFLFSEEKKTFYQNNIIENRYNRIITMEKDGRHKKRQTKKNKTN